MRCVKLHRSSVLEVYKKQFIPLKNFLVARYRDNNTENIIISQIQIHSDNFTMVQTLVETFN